MKKYENEKIMVEISRYFALMSHFGSWNYILYNTLTGQMNIVMPWYLKVYNNNNHY